MAGHLASFDADHALNTFAADYKFENGLLAIGKTYTADSPALSPISAYHHNRIFSPLMNYVMSTMRFQVRQYLMAKLWKLEVQNPDCPCLQYFPLLDRLFSIMFTFSEY